MSPHKPVVGVGAPVEVLRRFMVAFCEDRGPGWETVARFAQKGGLDLSLITAAAASGISEEMSASFAIEQTPKGMPHDRATPKQSIPMTKDSAQSIRASASQEGTGE